MITAHSRPDSLAVVDGEERPKALRCFPENVLPGSIEYSNGLETGFDRLQRKMSHPRTLGRDPVPMRRTAAILVEFRSAGKRVQSNERLAEWRTIAEQRTTLPQRQRPVYVD